MEKVIYFLYQHKLAVINKGSPFYKNFDDLICLDHILTNIFYTDSVFTVLSDNEKMCPFVLKLDFARTKAKNFKKFR